MVTKSKIPACPETPNVVDTEDGLKLVCAACDYELYLGFEAPTTVIESAERDHRLQPGA